MFCIILSTESLADETPNMLNEYEKRMQGNTIKRLHKQFIIFSFYIIHNSNSKKLTHLQRNASKINAFKLL